MTVFYIILGIVAIVGVAVLGSAALGGNQQSSNITLPASLDSFPSRGAADAPVTVVEFADFQCPGCGYFATNLEPAIVRDYIDTGKVRFIFHDFPLPQHANAIVAAEAARCAGEQNAFWPMHDLLYAKQSEWAESAQPTAQFIAYAEQLKLDRAAFEQCLNTHKYQATIQQAQRAAEQARVNQTPTFVINGQAYNSNQLRSAIDAALRSQ
jgi:protein-disulfide isomerase